MTKHVFCVLYITFSQEYVPAAETLVVSIRNYWHVFQKRKFDLIE